MFPYNHVTESPLSDNQLTLPRKNITKKSQNLRSDYSNRKAINNYSNVAPGNIPYSTIVWKGRKYYDLTRQYYLRNTQKKI